MLLRGYLSGYDGKELTIIAPFAGAQLLERQGITECEVRLLDGRQISPAQRRAE